MKNSREKEAINAYLKFLQNKGAASNTLYRRSQFLDALATELTASPLGRSSYGLGLDKALLAISSNDKYDFQITAREFYPFWIKDIKAIAAFDQHYGFNRELSNWQPSPATLNTLAKNLDDTVFDHIEYASLKDYAESLKKRGADSLVIETRTRMAKIILIRLQDAPTKNNNTYRMAVDLTLPLFKINDVKHLFLLVVREFYYFWGQDAVKRAA
jgi:hypothetical protein